MSKIDKFGIWTILVLLQVNVFIHIYQIKKLEHKVQQLEQKAAQQKECE